MNFKQWLLHEMPINQFKLIGNWDKEKPYYGYNRQDYGILTNPKAVQKIHKQWSNTKQNFDLYFIRSSQAFQKQNSSGYVITPEELKKEYGLDIQPNPNAITMIFTNNIGAEKIPMTGWMIAHRLAHAFYDDDKFKREFFDEMFNSLSNLFYAIYGIDIRKNNYENYQKRQNYLKAFVQTIGTMKSARTGNISRPSEFVFECVAQYIQEGKITFRLPPRRLITQKRFAWGHDISQGTSAINPIEKFAEEIQELAERFTNILDDFMIRFKGKILIL